MLVKKMYKKYKDLHNNVPAQVDTMMVGMLDIETKQKEIDQAIAAVIDQKARR